MGSLLGEHWPFRVVQVIGVEDTESVSPSITAVSLNGAYVCFTVARVTPNVVALRVANIVVSLVVVAQ